MNKNIKRTIGFVVTVIIAVILNYFWLPAWNFKSANMWIFFLFVTIIGIAIQYLIDGVSYYEKSGLGTKILFVVGVGMLLFLIIGGIGSSRMLNADKYRELITLEQGDFETDISEIQEVQNLSIVDIETAEKLGDRVIGNLKNATWYEVSNEYNMIRYQNNLYRISPLKYGGFWKFNKAKHEGIPGYVLVYAGVSTQEISAQEAQYVELESSIKYSPSALWSYDLERHLRSQYPHHMFRTTSFEVDENGKPYWITSVVTHTIGLFGGEKEDKVIITNASTGESEEYLQKDIPEWVDHAHGLNYLMQLAKDNLQYVNGWLNSIFGKTGVLRTSYSYRSISSDDETHFEGYNTAINSNGDIVYYTGLTPANNAETNVGFILANPRTGVITRYECAGAEESSAQLAAQGLVADLRYIATSPTVVNVNGTETFFMMLKDQAGLVQRYSLCNMKNYSQVVQAETLEKAIELYLEKIGQNSFQITQEDILTAEGNITELYEAQIDGCTYYYFIIEGNDNLFMSSIKNSNRQVLLKIGTNVNIEYVPSTEEGIAIVNKIAF